MIASLKKAARLPLLHFFLAGALLFVLQQTWEGHSQRVNPSRESIVIRPEQIEQFKRDIKAQTGLEPNAFQIQAAIEDAIDDEILYRRALGLKLDRINPGIRHRLVQIAKFAGGSPQDSENQLYEKALEMGLDKSDPVVRRQLIANMKLIARKLPSPSEPSRVSAEEIQAYYERHLDQFMLPERYTLSHVFVSKDRWKAKGEGEARRLLKELQAGGPPSSQAAAGDLFLRGNRLVRADAAALRDFFGSPSVAPQIAALEPGKWQGPIPSAYGWHLVWIEEKANTQAKPLREVSNQIKGDILNEREALRLEKYLREQRARYEIQVEFPQASSQAAREGSRA